MNLQVRQINVLRIRVDKIVDAKIYLEVLNVYVLQGAQVTPVNDAYVIRLNSDPIPAKPLYAGNTHFVNR